MDRNKRIWIRVEEETDPLIIMQDILELIQEDETMAGEIPVMLFRAESCMVKRLSNIYDLAECSVNVLKEKYGDFNVKLVCRQKEEQGESFHPSNMEKLVRDESFIERIVKSLESIDNNLKNLNETVKSVSQCVVQPGPDGAGKFLRITGDIQTSTY